LGSASSSPRSSRCPAFDGWASGWLAQLGPAYISRAFTRELGRPPDALCRRGLASAWFRATRVRRSRIGQARPERGRFRNASRNRARAPASYVKLLRRQASEAREQRRLFGDAARPRLTEDRSTAAPASTDAARSLPLAARVAEKPGDPSAENAVSRRLQPNFSKTEQPERVFRRTMPASTRSRPCTGDPLTGVTQGLAAKWSRSGRADPARAPDRSSRPSAVRRPQASTVGADAGHSYRTALMLFAHTSRERAMRAEHPAPHCLREPELSRGRPRRYPQPDPFRTPLFFAPAGLPPI
jgi:hypothetical protein